MTHFKQSTKCLRVSYKKGLEEGMGWSEGVKFYDKNNNNF